MKIWKDSRLIFSVAWLVLTVSLGFWWMLLGLQQSNEVSMLRRAAGGELAQISEGLEIRRRRMIVMEGVFFLTLLSVGGATLIWLTYRDLKRNRLLNDFFSTVTHEMKTPLASLQLQLETLLEDFSEDPVRGRLERLLTENRRIGSQINKAFELASLMREENLYLEEVDPAQIVERLRVDWSVIRMQDLQTRVRADRRALEGVLRNLVENAVQHGAASSVQISGTVRSNQMEIVVQDNGRGFAGRVSQLSEAFVRHSSTSGTGLGLYIVRRLITKMQGRVHFESNSQGFCVRISLPLYRPKTLSIKQNASQEQRT